MLFDDEVASAATDHGFLVAFVARSYEEEPWVLPDGTEGAWVDLDQGARTQDEIARLVAHLAETP